VAAATGWLWLVTTGWLWLVAAVWWVLAGWWPWLAIAVWLVAGSVRCPEVAGSNLLVTVQDGQ
jgi:hypothetical protein